MTLDSLSYVAPARIRGLLCPIGRIRRSRFSTFTERLRQAYVVRLGDVTHPAPANRSMFNPQAFPDGKIMWDLSTSVDREHEYLETFEQYRRTYLVIGIADYLEDNDPEVLHKQLLELKALYPRALHHVCLLFDAPADAAKNQKFKPISEYVNYLAVPAVQQGMSTSLRSLMSEITAPVLSELTSIGEALQDLPTLESPLEKRNSKLNPKEHRLSLTMPSEGLEPFGGKPILVKRKTMGFGGGYQSDRTQSKGKGRVRIALAQLFLIAGQTQEAMKEFVEGADVCRASNDHLWHGKALEGIGVCLVVLALLKENFQIPQIPYPTIEGSKAPKISHSASNSSTPASGHSNGHEPSATPQQVLELLSGLQKTIINLYHRASSFPGETIPHISYCEMILRYTKALTSMYLSNGESMDAISHVVFATPIPYKGKRNNIPSRVEIAETAMRAFPQPVEVMTVLEATRVLSGIASVLGTIGMKRRKALVTRELLKILIPGLIQARVIGAAEVGVHPAAGLSALSGSGAGSPLDLGEGDVESGIMELLEELCRAYGVFPGLVDPTEQLDRPILSGSVPSETSVWTRSVIEEQDIRCFGWPALKIQALKNCTSLCEALPDFQGVLTFTTQLLKTADMELSKEEQMRLSTTVSRTVGAARKLGLDNIEADYWDQFLIRNVELIENPNWRPPVPHNRSELLQAKSTDSSSAVMDTEKSLFIYDPFKVLKRSTAEQILVKGEAAEFKVTLQNPFEFELEIESVTLETSGVDLEVISASVAIAPFRSYQVSVFATPKRTGEVHISGCKVKVYGCIERAFPIFTEGLDSRERDPKTKRFGLAASERKVDRPTSTISTTGRSSLRPPPILRPMPKSLSLTAVESQPLLVVKNTSLSQSALMILEGERRVFQITLKNLSNVEVDLLVFSFTDSTTTRIQQALAEKTNSPVEKYELELMLSKKRAFVWHNPSQNLNLQPDEKDGDEAESGQSEIADPTQESAKRRIFVPANGCATFEIEALGKPDLTHGTIQVDYSCLGRPDRAVTDRFYTRELVYPVTVTVNASIELTRVDFIPFSADFNLAPSCRSSSRSSIDTSDPFKKLFAGMSDREDSSEYCLMLLDFRNSWPQPLQIKLSIKDDENSNPAWGDSYESEDVLQAGHTSRIILPVKRIFLSKAALPIPSLSASKRQFIVSHTMISVEQERQSREAFWYREELLKRLQGTWTELGTERTGEIELRGIRLSPRMVEIIRVENVGTSFSVKSCSDDTNANVTKIASSKFVVATDRSLILATTVVNRTSRRMRTVLRLSPRIKNHPMPAALDLNRRFVINGLLQWPLPSLEPGESKVFNSSFVILAKGEYEISASVEEVVVGPSLKEVMEGLDEEGKPMDVLGGTEVGARKCWVCREVCLIVARDVDQL